MVQPGDHRPVDGGLSPLLRSRIRGRCGLAGASREACAAPLSADRPRRRPDGRRSPPGAGRHARSGRADDSDQRLDRCLSRAAVSRSGVGDAAHRARLAAGRLREERTAARRAQRVAGGELGQPDQQGPDPRAARPRDRLERGAACRSRRAARRAAGPGGRHRRAALRRLVRGAAQPLAGGVLLARSGSTPTGRSCSTSARRASSPRRRCPSSSAGCRGCGAPPVRWRASPVSWCGRTPPTRASGAPSTPPRSRRCRCGRRSAPIPTGPTRGAITWTRSGTAPRWSASTPARKSRPRSSAGRSSRFATRTLPMRRMGRCTSGTWSRATDRCAWPTTSMPMSRS